MSESQPEPTFPKSGLFKGYKYSGRTGRRLWQCDGRRLGDVCDGECDPVWSVVVRYGVKGQTCQVCRCGGSRMFGCAPCSPHWVGVREAEQELPIVFVRRITHHQVLRHRVEIPQSSLEHARRVQGCPFFLTTRGICVAHRCVPHVTSLLLSPR
jgi:hypothetical protein